LFFIVSLQEGKIIQNLPAHLFPLPFCGHRWVENLPVAERATKVWPKLKEYVEAVRRKELPNPGTSSFDIIKIKIP